MFSFAEGCDGNDLGGQTCTSLGFGSGTLACSNRCDFDTTGCATCAAGSAGVAACKVVPSAGVFSALSLAATDSGVGIAWIEAPNGAQSQIGFALLSASLNVTSTGHILDAAIATPTPQAFTAQVATLPSGWVVLATTSASLSLYTLDAAGNVVAHNVLDPMSGGFGLDMPILVSQPNGGPLVIWEGGLSLYAAVVSADGLSVTTAIEVPATYDGNGVLPSLASAAFAAGKFQAVIQSNCSRGACLEIVSITPGGAIAGSFQVPDVTAPGGARLVSGADDLRLLYGADCGTTLSDPCLKWQRMSPTGAVLSPPVLVDGSPGSSLPESAVALGPDSYLSSANQNWSSTLIHLSSDGTIVGDPRPIAQGGAAGTAMVRLGSDLVAGWVTTTESLELARLTP